VLSFRIHSEPPLERQANDVAKNAFGYCPNHRTDVSRPHDFVVAPLQDVN
jgi:hypothetical protein